MENTENPTPTTVRTRAGLAVKMAALLKTQLDDLLPQLLADAEGMIDLSLNAYGGVPRVEVWVEGDRLGEHELAGLFAAWVKDIDPGYGHEGREWCEAMAATLEDAARNIRAHAETLPSANNQAVRTEEAK